jgi:hypothetical protein
MYWLSIIGIPVVVIIVALYFEYKIDPKTIPKSLLDIIIGTAIAFVVTFLVVNKVIDNTEQKKWIKVRNITYSQLIDRICDISASCTMFYRISIRDKWALIKDRFPPNDKTLSAFNDLIQDLNKHNINGKIPVTYNEGDDEADTKFYEEVKFDLDHIQIVLIPRVIQGHGEQELIDALVAFESAGNKLRHDVFDRHTCFPQVVSLIEKAHIVYETIYNERHALYRSEHK